MATRTRVTHVKPRPRCGVDEVCYDSPMGFKQCEEPAVAKWDWEKGGWLFACQKHDREIRRNEAEIIKEQTNG